jgi:group I intron endonuclease
MGYIYLITNTINDKWYFGQTTDSPKVRMNKHRSDCRRHIEDLKRGYKLKNHGGCPKLYNAMYAHGMENFHMEVVAVCETQDELNKCEVYHINMFDTIINGYNIKEGGDSGRHSEETKQVISQKTKEGITKHIDKYRDHDEVKGMPKHVVFNKQKQSLSVYRHPALPYKSFSLKRYGSWENVRAVVLEYLNTQNQINNV